MIDRPVLRYHGGKFRIARWIISHFPPHRFYVEPYAGAASVLMAKPRAPAEVLNEIDDRIVNVFRVLRDPVSAAALKRRLELTPFSRKEFNAAYGKPTDDVDAAAKTITLSFMGQGSDAVTRGYRTGFRCATRNRDNTAIPAHEWADWPSQIPAFVERLKGVALESVDALALMHRFRAQTTTLFYVDPPYPHSTRSAARSRHGYKYEMTDDDHRELAKTLRGLAGMVILSGYACDLYDRDLFPDWSARSIEARADRGRKRTEVIWLNPQCLKAQSQVRLFG
jgi:DNA adenine methylase